MMRAHAIRILIATAMLVLGHGEAAACSCVHSSLQNRFHRSAHVFTAVIVDEYTEPADAQTPIRSTFALKETFKGRPSFPAFMSHQSDASCGIDLQVGVEYLFFTGDTGEIGSCAGIRPVESIGTHVELLRAFTAGQRDDLAEPWQFTSEGGNCLLQSAFDTAADWSPSYIEISASNERAIALRGQPQFDFVEAEVRLALPFAEDPGPVVLTAGDRTFTASWTTDRVIEVAGLPGPLALPGSHVLLGDAVAELVEALTGSELSVRYDAQGYGANVDIPIRAAGRAETAAQMLACIEAARP